MHKFILMTVALLACAWFGLAVAQDQTPAPSDREAEDLVQEYVAVLREALTDGKVTVYQQIMALSDDEALVFWPLYRDYEEDLFEHGDQRLVMARDLVEAIEKQTLDQPSARKLSAEWFRLQHARLDLLKKHHDLIAEALSEVHAAQFLQIESRTNLMIDLMVASNMPLIGDPDERLAPQPAPAE